MEVNLKRSYAVDEKAVGESIIFSDVQKSFTEIEMLEDYVPGVTIILFVSVAESKSLTFMDNF